MSVGDPTTMAPTHFAGVQAHAVLACVLAIDSTSLLPEAVERIGLAKYELLETPPL